MSKYAYNPIPFWIRKAETREAAFNSLRWEQKNRKEVHK